MGVGRTAGRRSRSWLLKTLFVVGSFTVAAAVAAGVVSGADQPSLTSNQTEYAPGATVSLSGAGWQAGERVHIAVDDDSDDAWSHEAEVTAAADGSVSDEFELSEDVSGAFSATATATSGTAGASFTVTAPPIPSAPPTLDSDEEEYEAGATVTLTGSNWTAGDTVHLAVDDDGDDAWEHPTEVTVADDGSITDSFDLPDDLDAEFTATATDPSDRSATATFTTSAWQPTGSATEPYLVRFASGTSSETQAQVLAGAGAVSESYIAPLRIHAVLLPGGTALQTSVDRLRSNSAVTRVEQDRTREVGATPNDSNYGDQWALPKIGWDNVYGTSSPGGSAKVAILDTGVEGSHSDLNIAAGTSILDGSDGRSDPNGHGTAMAGIVAAKTNNASGIAGVGFAGVQVMPVTVLGSDGTGQDSDIIEGVVYAADHDADVILMAFSNPGYSELLQAAIDYAWDEGAVLVAAAGNDSSSSPQFPAGDRGVIGVSNTDQNDGLAGSSNSGQAIFLGAPGTAILTTDSGGGTTTISGTSASAANVGGVSGADQGGVRRRERRHRVAVGAERGGRWNAGPDRERAPEPRPRDRGHLDCVGAARGAAPVGGGGPFVGPYVAAANNFNVTPLIQTVSAGSTSNFTWIFTAQNSSNVPTTTFTIPAGWTTPSASPGPGRIVVTAGTCNASLNNVSGMVVTINQQPSGCNNNQTFSLSYQNATAPTPAVTTTYTFTNQHGQDPQVIVTALVARSTSTTVTCSPATVVLNQGTSCDTQVDDTALGTKSPPAGTVTFTRSGPGAGTFSSTTCTLTPVDADSSHCATSVTYTPSSGPGRT